MVFKALRHWARERTTFSEMELTHGPKENYNEDEPDAKRSQIIQRKPVLATHPKRLSFVVRSPLFSSRRRLSHLTCRQNHNITCYWPMVIKRWLNQKGTWLMRYFSLRFLIDGRCDLSHHCGSGGWDRDVPYEPWDRCAAQISQESLR